MKRLQLIPAICQIADQLTRNDLAHGRIQSEPAYVAALVTRIRDMCMVAGIKSVARSEDLGGEDSRKTGADAILVFKCGQRGEVALFEAKWPRFSRKPVYRWDWMQKRIQRSHFADQIMRQADWAQNAYIWEQFLSESPLGKNSPEPEFASNGCTCVWHHTARSCVYSAMGYSQPWTHDDLRALVAAQWLFWENSLADMIRWVLLPRSQTRVSAKSLAIDCAGRAKLESKSGKVIEVPCTPTIASGSVLQDFQRETHISHYLLIGDDEPPTAQRPRSDCEHDRTMLLRSLVENFPSGEWLQIIRNEVSIMKSGWARDASHNEERRQLDTIHRKAKPSVSPDDSSEAIW